MVVDRGGVELGADAAVSLADAMGDLPAPHECIHLWVGWRHSMGHVLAAIASKTEATCEELLVASLSFSRDNINEVATMMDAGRLKEAIKL